MLQQHILQQLGLPSQPNTSALYPNYNVSRVRIAIDHLYPENRESLAASTEEYLSKVLQTLPPSCETPRNADRTWDDGSSFRMYFDVPAQKQRADKVDILTTATLKLYKLPVEDKNNTCNHTHPIEDEESECDCRHKPKRKNRPLEQVDDDDDEDTDEDIAERRGQRSRRHGRRKNRTERVSKGEVEVAEEETDREVEEDNIDEQENLDNVNILVYQYRRPVKKNKHENVKLIASIAAPKDKEGWVHLDIKDAVDHWMRHPRKNFGIKIEVQDSQRKEIDPYEIFRTYNCSMELNSNLSLPLAMAMMSADESGPGTGNETGDPLVMNVTFPMLDIVTTTSEKQQQETSTRYKRQAINRRRSRCVMEKMYISLEDLLLDWVVSPQVFETGFCRGSCSVAADHSGAYIRSYRKNAYSPSDRSTLANPTSCCGPTQTKPLNILYFNKDRELTITKINDFIVTECGCRD